MGSNSYIKIFDKKAAAELASCGFLYMQEGSKVGDVTYVFEDSEEVRNAIEKISTSEFEEVKFVVETTLYF